MVSQGGISRYDFVGALPGGFGQRWIGATADPQRVVVLRALPTTSLSPDELEEVTRAGIAAMVIRHPRVAAVLDVIPAESQIAVVSEYVEGVTLREVQRAAAASGRPLPPTVALSILRDALEGLLAARDQWKQMVHAGGGMLADGVHGGLSPEGITISILGEAMLSETGVMGALARHAELVEHPEMLPYRAPEQVLRTEGLMERCDVFTLGVMAWELLASRPLFGHPGRLQGKDREERSSVVKSVLEGPIPPLDTLPDSDIPSAVSDVVRNALLRDPLRRFSSLDKLAAALADLPRTLFAPTSEVAAVLRLLVGPALQDRRDTVGLVEVTYRSVSPPAPVSRRSLAPASTPTERASMRAPRSRASLSPSRASLSPRLETAATPAEAAEARASPPPPAEKAVLPQETGARPPGKAGGIPTPLVPPRPKDLEDLVAPISQGSPSSRSAPPLPTSAPTSSGSPPPVPARPAPTLPSEPRSRTSVWIGTGVVVAAIAGFFAGRSLVERASTSPSRSSPEPLAPAPTASSEREARGVADAGPASSAGPAASAPKKKIPRILGILPATDAEPPDAEATVAPDDGGPFRPSGI